MSITNFFPTTTARNFSPRVSLKSSVPSTWCNNYWSILHYARSKSKSTYTSRCYFLNLVLPCVESNEGYCYWRFMGAQIEYESTQPY